MNITAPDTVTIDAMTAKIDRVQYAAIPDTTLTLCFVHMRNGYVLVGKSACVDPAKFDREMGERISYNDAIDQLWKLEGYLLSEDRYRSAISANQPS
jgi:hypothetical protein